jgi:hypothetical protein
VVLFPLVVEEDSKDGGDSVEKRRSMTYEKL